MTIYRKCRLCIRREGCSIKANIGHVISGLGITSLLHKCDDYEPPFKPGDPVLVTTIADYGDIEFPGGELTVATFPGHFLEQRGFKAHVYIKPDIDDVTGDYEFGAKNNGYCSLPFSRVAPNPDGKTIKLCHGVPDFDCDCFGLVP